MLDQVFNFGDLVGKDSNLGSEFGNNQTRIEVTIHERVDDQFFNFLAVVLKVGLYILKNSENLFVL